MTAIRWSRVALAVALTTGVILAFAPLASSTACEVLATGIEECTTSRQSVVQSQGLSVIGLVFLPAVLALGPALRPSPRSRMTLAILLTVLVVVGIASVGLLLVPTLIVAWVAVAADGNLRPRLAGAIESQPPS